jgi:hypothetical protein
MPKKKLQETLSVQTIVEGVDQKLLQYIMPVNKAEADILCNGKSTRVICEINGFEFPCALRPRKVGDYFVGLSKEKMKKAKLLEGMQVMATFRLDTSEYGFTLPEEFAEILAQDEEGKRAFEACPPSYQRGWLHYISSGKAVDTRIKRGFYILERAKEKLAEREAKQ